MQAPLKKRVCVMHQANSRIFYIINRLHPWYSETSSDEFIIINRNIHSYNWYKFQYNRFKTYPWEKIPWDELDGLEQQNPMLCTLNRTAPVLFALIVGNFLTKLFVLCQSHTFSIQILNNQRLQRRVHIHFYLPIHSL